MPVRGGTKNGLENLMSNYQFLATWLKAHTASERGASLVEYALLLALIAVVCIFAVSTLGGEVEKKFNTVSTEIAKDR
jgi:pilus assembly protein Flp/PilA